MPWLALTNPENWIPEPKIQSTSMWEGVAQPPGQGGGGGAAAGVAAAVGCLEVGAAHDRAEHLGTVVVVAGEDHRGAVGGELVGQPHLDAHRHAAPARVVAVVGRGRRVVGVEEPHLATRLLVLQLD